MTHGEINALFLIYIYIYIYMNKFKYIYLIFIYNIYIYIYLYIYIYIYLIFNIYIYTIFTYLHNHSIILEQVTTSFYFFKRCLFSFCYFVSSFILDFRVFFSTVSPRGTFSLYLVLYL